MIYQFILNHNGTDYTLPDNEQPNGFTSLNSVIERDFVSGGAFFKLTEADLRLDFPGGARDFLKTALDNDGVDATVTLTINKRPDVYTAYTTIYTGEAVFKDYEYSQDYFSCDFVETSILNTINNNKNTKVSLDATQDLFGNAISAATTQTITFLPLDLTSSGRKLSSEDIYTFTGSGGATRTYLMKRFTEEENEIVFPDDRLAFVNSGFEEDTSDMIYGGSIDLYPQDSSYDVTIQLQAVLNFTTTGTVTGSLTIRLERLDLDALTSSVIGQFGYTPGTDGNLTDHDLSANLSSGTFYHTETIATTDSPKRFRLRMFDSLAGSVAGDTVTIGITPGAPLPLSITATSYYGADQSSAVGVTVFNAIDKNLEIITGTANLLVSDYFSSGDGSTIYESNGYNIRASTRGINQSLMKRIEMVKSVFGCGMGLETSYPGDSIDRVRIEPYEFFFQGVELMSLDDIEIESYKEEYFQDLDYNRINVGYNKYGNNEEFSNISSGNDYNTEANYAIPVQKTENELVLKTDYIASPILIELTRRQQYLDTSKAWKYDNDTFLLDCIAYQGLVAPRADSGIQTDGVGSIDYNLLLNPRFNLWNNSRLINSIVYAKDFADVYQVLDFELNETSKIGYSTTFSNPGLGDIRTWASSAPVPRMNADIEIGDFSGGLRLFDPFKITFRTAITETQKNNLIDAHRNGLTSGNYGYITVLNPDGEYVSGWLLRASFNIVEEISTFELIKRAENYL